MINRKNQGSSLGLVSSWKSALGQNHNEVTEPRPADLFEHCVQFYETDAFLLNRLVEWGRNGLVAGEAVIVVATKEHREALYEQLELSGLDLATATASGQYVALDAAETLSKFMLDSLPDPVRFAEVMTEVIARATSGGRRTRIFGEMVAILWAEAKYAAAVRLEELWNDLGKAHTFSLFCGYPLNGFAGGAVDSSLAEMCAKHSHLIPAESYSELEHPDERVQSIIQLQQKARSVEAEIEKRKELENRLQISEIHYRRHFEAARDGLLIVDPDTHKIADANPCMSEFLATPHDELVGKELWEVGVFADREATMEALRELREKQVVRYENLPLRAKDGQQREVEFVGNIYSTNGDCIIQCNVRDIADRRRAEETGLHLAAIVESSDDAIISKSLDGIILSWNKGAERIFGYTAAEVIGKSILVLIPPDKFDEEQLILGRLRRGELIDHYETVRQSKDGRLINISLTVSPIKDGRGKIIASSKIARDITDRKRTEATIREQAAIIDTINRIGQILAAELNTQSVLQAVSDAATELIGARYGSFFCNSTDHEGRSSVLYTVSGISREDFADLSTPRDRDLFGLTLQGAKIIRIANVKNDPSFDKNAPLYDLPPDYLPVTSYLAVPVKRSNKVLGGLFFGHPDEGVFTERHESIVAGLAAQALIAMDNARLYELAQGEQAKAEAANRTKDEFLATVSHELRTPLNAIIGWTHLLRRGNLDATTVVRAVETIERNAKSQAQLVEDILDVSRVITGKLRLNMGAVDLATVINAAIDAVQLAADAKGVRLSVTLDPSARHISGDSGRLQQVIWNLLSNAIKFTPPGGRIEVLLDSVDSDVQIRVSDSGQGISADFLPFIFDRFRQADGSSTRRHGGLGLGLAIVRHLVEQHGGTVQVESQGEGCGATFTIKLPAMSLTKSLQVQKRDTGGLPSLASLRPIPSLAGLQLLLVDDDPDSIQALSAVLAQFGAKVRTAFSAAQALEIFEWYAPDVLISDLAMPDEDGYSLIARIRDRESKMDRQTPAVALTSYVSVEDRTRALEAGFDIFVPKPVEPTELIAVIADLKESRTTKADVV